MQEQPIITTITSQQCIGYREHPDGGISIIENVGVDTGGKWWRWRSETLHRFDGISSNVSDYLWVRTTAPTPPADSSESE